MTKEEILADVASRVIDISKSNVPNKQEVVDLFDVLWQFAPTVAKSPYIAAGWIAHQCFFKRVGIDQLKELCETEIMYREMQRLVVSDEVQKKNQIQEISS